MKKEYNFSKMKRRPNKYGNRAASALQIYFRSKAERDHALWLESEKQAGKILGWKYEKSYDLFAARQVSVISEGKTILNDKILIGKHKVDFTVTLSDGREEVHEVKGGTATQTEAWRLRKKIFEANYPHIAYKVFGGKREWPIIQF